MLWWRKPSRRTRILHLTGGAAEAAHCGLSHSDRTDSAPRDTTEQIVLSAFLSCWMKGCRADNLHHPHACSFIFLPLPCYYHFPSSSSLSIDTPYRTAVLLFLHPPYTLLSYSLTVISSLSQCIHILSPASVSSPAVLCYGLPTMKGNSDRGGVLHFTGIKKSTSHTAFFRSAAFIWAALPSAALHRGDSKWHCSLVCCWCWR